MTGNLAKSQSTMSSILQSHAVRGYMRNNYDHNVPEALVRICISYFQDTTITFRGKQLDEFLLMEAKDASDLIKIYHL